MKKYKLGDRIKLEEGIVDKDIRIKFLKDLKRRITIDKIQSVDIADYKDGEFIGFRLKK